MQSSLLHDEFFKKALENSVVAKEFFTAHLPANIKSIVDLEHLKMEKESFIDESLKKSFNDVLFTTSFAGETGYLWLLIEHQSSVDHLMSFRLLRYMTNIWQRHLEQHKNIKILPIIYPLILYNGKAKYTAPLSLWQLFADPLLAKSCLDQFQLINLNNISDDELARHNWAGIFEYFMKHIFERDFLKILRNSQEMIIKIYNEDQDDALSYLRMILYYNISKVSRENSDALKQILNEITIQQGENIMASLAHTWEQEGIQKGVQQGMQQGIQQGIQQGMQQGMQQGRAERDIEIARKLLARGDSLADVTAVTGLSSEELKKL